MQRKRRELFDKVAAVDQRGDLLEKLITHVSGFEWPAAAAAVQRKQWASALDGGGIQQQQQPPSGGHDEQTNKTSTSSSALLPPLLRAYTVRRKVSQLQSDQEFVTKRQK